MLFLRLNSETYSPACVDLKTWRIAWVVNRKIVDCVPRQTLRGGSLQADCNTGCALSLRLTASVAMPLCLSDSCCMWRRQLHVHEQRCILFIDIAINAQVFSIVSQSGPELWTQSVTEEIRTESMY